MKPVAPNNLVLHGGRDSAPPRTCAYQAHFTLALCFQSDWISDNPTV